MPLVDMTSDLTSLKYGRDRRGGGWSGQPYFTKDIPERAESINFANSFLGNDFLIRGGVRSVTSVLEDEIRLGKFLSSFKSPNGLLFTTKQTLLSRQAPLTGASPDRFYNPLSLLAQTAVNPIGLHFSKQGKNLRIDDNDKYFKKTKNSYNTVGTNKLLLLYDTNLVPYSDPLAQSPDAINQSLDYASQTGDFGAFKTELANEDSAAKSYIQNKARLGVFGISSNPQILFQYQGGPNAAPGQKSVVRRVFDTNEGLTRNRLFSSQKEKDPKVTQFLVYTQDLLQQRVSSTSTGFGGSGITNFESKFISAQTSTGVKAKRIDELIGKPTNYVEFNRVKTYGEGDAGLKGRNRAAYYTTNLRNGNNTTEDINNVYAYDSVNAQPLYSSKDVSAKKEKGYNDIIKFNIGVVNLEDSSITTWIHFRSYINNFNDSYGADWQSYKYMGRGNNFYKYNGYNRDISMGFDVVVHSKYEQAFIYDKLNYLASTLAPNYSGGGFMRGNILKLTVGDYLNNTYGILKSINLSIPDDTPWDIGRGLNGTEDSGSLQLPQRITVSNFAFTPIHNFRESTVNKNYTDGINKLPNSKFISLGEGGKGYEFTHEARGANVLREQ